MAGREVWPLLTGRFALLVLLGSLLFPLAPAGETWLWWAGYNLILLLLALADWLASPRAGELLLSPLVKGQWVRGEQQSVGLTLNNASDQTVAMEVRQDAPLELGGPAPALQLEAAAGAEAAQTCRLAPRERGEYRLGAIHGRWRSRLGLLLKRGLWAAEIPVRVYAPLYIDRGPGLPAPQLRVQEHGTALVRAGGVHTEFESLREYQEGDEYRTVNWRASARRGRLVVNQYQAERTQQVMLVLDAGRLMVPEYRGIPRFEYALSAALQLGRLAAEREDRVGMMAFGANVEMLIPPGRGQAQVARLAEAAHRVQPQMVEPDYAGAFARLSGSIKRRSLVLCFTDFVSPASSRAMVEHLVRLVPRHVVVVLAVSDPAMTALAGGEAGNLPQAYTQAAAQWALEERAAARAALARQGIAVLDVPPLALSSAAINRYLAVKRQGLL